MRTTTTVTLPHSPATLFLAARLWLAATSGAADLPLPPAPDGDGLEMAWGCDRRRREAADVGTRRSTLIRKVDGGCGPSRRTELGVPTDPRLVALNSMLQLNSTRWKLINNDLIQIRFGN